jgi:vitamin B12 transporter
VRDTQSAAFLASSLVLGSCVGVLRLTTASAQSPAEPAAELGAGGPRSAADTSNAVPYADGVPSDALLPVPDDPPAEVVVRTVSGATRLRESAQAVKIVEGETARRHSADVGEVLARTEGVAVQRTGGLGSESRLSLHGLTDDQIRLFIDGVPLEFSGFGLGVSVIPISWVERIEVYRGVVPVRLGADALGGAIDIVTDQRLLGTTAAVAYTAGAFDTHQLSLNARTFHTPTGLLVRAAAFHDTSRNDYQVDVRVPDTLGRLQPASVRRFHDGCRALGASAEVGVVDRPWARRLMLRLFSTTFDKEIQHNVDMSVPYGEVTTGQTAIGGTLRYELPRTEGTPFSLNGLLGYSRRSIDFLDASRRVYDWFGNVVFERAENSGEITPFASDLTQWEQRVLGRVGAGYSLAPEHSLELVIAPDFTTRTGEERRRLDPDRIDPLTTRRDLFQLVSGLEYAFRDEDERVENSAFVKHYLYRPSTDQVDVAYNTIRHLERSTQNVGAGDAFRMRALDGVIGKASYEYAMRLPRADEVFGDGALVTSNLELTPETSHNANLGALLEGELGERGGSLTVEASGFLRYTEGMIVQLIADDRVHSIHQNVFTVRTLGTDGMLRWSSRGQALTLQANGTYLDQRNDSTQGPFVAFRGQRVPNRPWLFANASVLFRLPRIASGNDQLSLSWVTRYVRSFLPGWDDDDRRDDESRIPKQITHSAGIEYLVRGPYTMAASLDLSNLTDERVYDVLGVQRPGRATFFKMTGCWAC